MKHHLKQWTWQNMSEEERQNYNALYDNFVKVAEKFNKTAKELKQSKYDLGFWYNEQKNAKSAASKSYPISVRTLKEKREYYSPATFPWEDAHLPSYEVLNYAMSLYYKELIKYGETLHKKLKTEQESINTEMNILVLRFKNLERDLNKKYTAMWFPIKVTIDAKYAEEHSIRTDENDKTIAWIDVNPNNGHKIQVDCYGGCAIIDRENCLNIETYPEEKVFGCNEEYKNVLKEYAKLYSKM